MAGAFLSGGAKSAGTQCVNNEILGKVTNALPPYKNGVTK